MKVQPTTRKLVTSPYERGNVDNWFPKVGDLPLVVSDAIVNGGVGDADILLLWGGRDINSSFYGQAAHPKNQSRVDSVLVERDRLEWTLIKQAVAVGVPIIGICRGAQMLCAFAGGSLYQDVSDHNRSHTITTYDGETLSASGDHHQMMNLYGTDYRMLAWSTTKLSAFYDSAEPDDGTTVPIEEKEPEVVYFPRINALAIQPHPEWEPKGSKFCSWISQTTSKFLSGEL